MKKAIIPMACIAAALSTPAHAATQVFEADFESGTAANTGTITYTNAGPTQLSVTSGPDATLGNNVLFVDPTSSGTGNGITNFRLTPTSAASLTGGQTAVVSLDYAQRRSNGTNKSHYVTGYDSSDAIIFQFVLAELNEFSNTGGNDRQQPGYATSSGSLGLLAGDIASGTNPGTFYFGNDGNNADGFNANLDAHFDITVGASGWTIAGDGQNATKPAFTTNTLATYTGATHNELAYVEITGETTAAGGYFDNLTIESVPEPSSAALLGLGGLALILRRRK